ncbi:MAG TPA: fibronectin type III domain-containing protein [Polyangiaceae bacterium]
MSMHKTLAALRLPTQVPALLSVAEAIVLAMSISPSFPEPTPALASVRSAIMELHDAQVATLTRTRGTAAVRDRKLAVLVGLLARLKGYVEGVADEDPEHAVAVIESAGMHVKRSTARNKPGFDVRAGRVSGSVRLVTRSAGDRAAYLWAWSSDGGSTWHTVPQTIQARTVVSGLPPASTCWFRYRAVTKSGETDWSEPLSFVVR